MDKKFAVFVDGDNICAKDYMRAIWEIGALYGEILVKRVYGDWTTPNMKTWKEVLANEPATACQQFRSGKNATDTRIIMDAIELMICNSTINAFAIISTDADFCGLAIRLRENGKFVLGIGNESANLIWQESCTKFVKLESHTNEETGFLIKATNFFGLIKNEQGVFHFSPTDVDGDINNMKKGSQVKFKLTKEPDITQLDKKNQRGKATGVRLVA
jgi:uncharacterized protein (TIGR00288 family)